jgi:metallo-beta-lactamase family protein
MKTVSPPLAAEPVVTFLGAARSVTGSMHLVAFGRSRLLLDCGAHRGRRDEARERNRSFPFDPAGIDAVVLSHAHVDHCGNLPALVRQGFRGPIYCTPATRDLAAIMLTDSARVHEEDAAVAAVVHGPAPDRAAAFTRSDADRVVDRCVAVPYGEPFGPADGCTGRFLDAGHILGSAITALAFSRGADTYRLTFTGDLGRRGLPFVREPSPVPAADLVLSESTYGGRLHDTRQAMAAKVADVTRATVARGGRVLVPAFSLGRTQIVLHYLRRWMRDGLVPELPLVVDSPLAAAIARVHARHRDLLAAGPEDTGPPVRYVASPEEHRELARATGPAIVIASGGMCDGGRILAHLKHHLDDPRSSVVLVSYQAPHTPGAQLLELRPTVRFHGRTWNKWADVVQVNGFSGHADHADLLALLGPAAADTGRVRLVHGEPPQAEALARALREHGFADVAVPERLETAAAG